MSLAIHLVCSGYMRNLLITLLTMCIMISFVFIVVRVLVLCGV